MRIYRRFISRFCARSAALSGLLALAQQISAEDISARVRYFGEVEADLILSPDREFRFHSGVPAAG